MKCENLEQVRENIDRIDNEIIKLIAEEEHMWYKHLRSKKMKRV